MKNQDVLNFSNQIYEHCCIQEKVGKKGHWIDSLKWFYSSLVEIDYVEGVIV